MEILASDIVLHQQRSLHRRSARVTRLLVLGTALFASAVATPATSQSPVPIAPNPAQGSPVAAQAVLYEEDSSEPKGRRYSGSVVWSEEVLKGAGLADD